jgi:hypothetical protein
MKYIVTPRTASAQGVLVGLSEGWYIGGKGEGEVVVRSAGQGGVWQRIYSSTYI